MPIPTVFDLKAKAKTPFNELIVTMDGLPTKVLLNREETIATILQLRQAADILEKGTNA